MTGKTISLETSPIYTIATIKDMIYDREGVPHTYQRIIHGGKQLHNGYTLADYNILKESTLYMNLRLRGGMQGSNGEKAMETWGYGQKGKINKLKDRISNHYRRQWQQRKKLKNENSTQDSKKISNHLLYQPITPQHNSKHLQESPIHKAVEDRVTPMEIQETT